MPRTAKNDPYALNEDIKEKLEDSVYFAVRRSQALFISGEREDGIHATTASHECGRMLVYAVTATSGGRMNMNAQTMESFWLGLMLHRSMDLKGKLHESTMAYDIVKGKPLKVKDGKVQWEDSEKEDVIVGTLDDFLLLNIDGGEHIIVDKKTHKSNGYVLRDANQEHKDQCSIYRFLLKKCYDIDVQYGANVYFDSSEALRKPVVFAYKLLEVDKMHGRLASNIADVKEYRETGKLPKRVRGFMCDTFCSYAVRCFSDND